MGVRRGLVFAVGCFARVRAEQASGCFLVLGALLLEHGPSLLFCGVFIAIRFCCRCCSRLVLCRCGCFRLLLLFAGVVVVVVVVVAVVVVAVVFVVGGGGVIVRC